MTGTLGTAVDNEREQAQSRARQRVSAFWNGTFPNLHVGWEMTTWLSHSAAACGREENGVISAHV